MNDDIVDDLKSFAVTVEQAKGYAWVVMLAGEIFNRAAAEIEELRKICQMLAHDVECPDPGCDQCGHGFDAWQDYEEAGPIGSAEGAQTVAQDEVDDD
jgi:hypothetical protein